MKHLTIFYSILLLFMIGSGMVLPFIINTNILPVYVIAFLVFIILVSWTWVIHFVLKQF
jgi:hypothetical protein